MAWTSRDFLLMGAILFTACAAFELAVRAQGGLAYRAATGLGPRLFPAGPGSAIAPPMTSFGPLARITRPA